MPVSHVNNTLSKAVSYAISHGYQIAPDALRVLEEAEKRQKEKGFELMLDSVIELAIEEKVRGTLKKTTTGSTKTISVSDLVETQPDLFGGIQLPDQFSYVPDEGEFRRVDKIDAEVEIVNDPSQKIQPVGIGGFSELFKSRYEKLIKILKERPEARQLSKISELKGDKVERVVGLVYSKRPRKNALEVVIDDESGKISALALNDEAKRSASALALDECIMVELDGRRGRFLVNRVTEPDIPNRIPSSSKKTVYVLLLSDLHIGSKKFLQGPFSRLLDWLSGKGLVAEQDKEIIKRLKYVVIAGDIVDGVGIFPNQEYELEESNVYKQYEIVSRKLALVPGHLAVFVIPGNHDATRQALPQPMIPRTYAQSLYDLKNVTMLGDPALIRLHGVSILTYHGRSLDDVLATTPGLSYERPTQAMKVLLKARHLAPTFGLRTPIAPEIEDYLVIDQVPDVFHAGHIHSVGVESYKGTLMINSGAWQAQTAYQANLGIMPRPGLVPILDLATLEVTTREFLTTYETISNLSMGSSA